MWQRVSFKVFVTARHICLDWTFSIIRACGWICSQLCSWSWRILIVHTEAFVLTVLRWAVTKGEAKVAPVHVFDGDSNLWTTTKIYKSPAQTDTLRYKREQNETQISSAYSDPNFYGHKSIVYATFFGKSHYLVGKKILHLSWFRKVGHQALYVTGAWQ